MHTDRYATLPRPIASGVPEGDDTLVSRWRRGDEQAFDRLVDRHGREVRGFLVNRLRDGEVAEEAWAETFLKVVRARDRFERGRSFRGWLFTIARRVAFDASRTARRRRAFEGRLGGERPDPSLATDPTVAAVLSRERQELLARALQELPPEHREVVRLICAGRTTGEIARDLGLAEQQVRDRLAYARRVLRSRLEA